MSGGHFHCLQNYPGVHFGDFQYYKGRKCLFRDSRELIGCCMFLMNFFTCTIYATIFAAGILEMKLVIDNMI